MGHVEEAIQLCGSMLQCRAAIAPVWSRSLCCRLGGHAECGCLAGL